MSQSQILDRAAAVLLILVTVLFAAQEWGVQLPPLMLEAVTLLALILLSLRVKLARIAFVLTGIALVTWLALTGDDWTGVARAGLEKSAFIAAFFTALSTLRHTAETSPALRRIGEFLAAQPPGRRYAALTTGGHLFALLINYGSLSLLGSLATHAANAEADAVIRRHRTRRMLLAIQRGFISSLTWSPLAFAMAITVALIPGATWAGAVKPGLISAAIILASGWAMDWIFKPKLAGLPPRQPQEVEGSWAVLMPLAALLAILALTITGISAVTEVRVVGIVMVVVPVMAILWALVQRAGLGPAAALGPRTRRYVDQELPGYRGELVLLMMAGFIGTVGAPVLQPVIASLGLDLGRLPAPVVLAGFVWLVPLLGQIGMNPILAITLIAPLIPTAQALGVRPDALVVAIASGWALSGATSPFTATTLLIGAFGKVSAVHVGLRWNGGYFLVTASLLTVWVLLYGLVIA
jgi:hypothetical protein